MKRYIRTILLVFITTAQTMNSEMGQEHLSVMPGYEKEALIKAEDFSGGLGNWMTEGKVVARIEIGRLYFESADDTVENPKGNIWWHVDVHEPYALEFDYKSLSKNGLSMIFWNATEPDGSPVFTRNRTGRYEEYINGMHAYHVSFHRFGSGKSNIRKAPGFHLVSSATDPIAPGDTLCHHIVIASAGKRYSDCLGREQACRHAYACSARPSTTL